MGGVSQKSLVQRRSMTKLVGHSPYSSSAGKANEMDGSNEYLAQQNQELAQTQQNLRTQLQQMGFVTDGLKSDLF